MRWLHLVQIRQHGVRRGPRRHNQNTTNNSKTLPVHGPDVMSGSRGSSSINPLCLTSSNLFARICPAPTGAQRRRPCWAPQFSKLVAGINCSLDTKIKLPPKNAQTLLPLPLPSELPESQCENVATRYPAGCYPTIRPALWELFRTMPGMRCVHAF